jgi:hypothetical protein
MATTAPASDVKHDRTVQDLKTLDASKLNPLSMDVMSHQATINIGTIGHVAHGKVCISLCIIVCACVCASCVRVCVELRCHTCILLCMSHTHTVHILY